MAYIIKNTSGLLNTRFTDTGRKKLSKGKLNITYFQIGDSEVCYDAISGYNLTNNYILEPAYNAQNSTIDPERNKMNIKYPYYVNNSSGSTYGIPYDASDFSLVYNTAAPRGFFTGDTNDGWTAQTSSAYTINSNYITNTCNCTNNNIIVTADTCSASASGTPSVGDFVTIYFDNAGSCGDISSNYPILTYKIQYVDGNTLGLDRELPKFINDNCCGNARVIVYPSGMTQLYDSVTPEGYYAPSVLNFETICELSGIDVKIWNMNIPWSTSPAGVISTENEDYTKYASAPYLGSKEYFGYQNISGQTFYIDDYYSAETTDTYYYNSFDEIIKVQPYEQKAIAIVHYTNNAIDTFYGEKFAMNPYDSSSLDNTGAGRNFKVTIPWLMWHKSSTCTIGETFYVDPLDLGLFQVHYMKSTKNPDMNNPGLRYYTLWDTHLNADGYPSRVGKVFPDLKTIVFDDDEIVAAMSYKSNRNWTLPAPSTSLITPNVCDTNEYDYGVLGNSDEYMYITYRFDSSAFTNSLHCNYYTKLQGPLESCNLQRQNVAVRFGDEFCFMNYCCFSGFNATEFKILAQIVTGSTTQPSPDEWVEIDFTEQLSASTINGYIAPSAFTSTTFVITYNNYAVGRTYNLANYIQLPTTSGEEEYLNFGDEYYFYGNIETDVEATIYEMKFLCNLASTQFNNTSNPTWTPGTKSYVTEIGLFDADKDLIVITKLQSPILRQGVQQFTVKMDF